MSKAVVKKVKNSSISGTKVKALVEDAVATLPTKEELKEELQPVVTKSLVESIEEKAIADFDAGVDVDFIAPSGEYGFGCMRVEPQGPISKPVPIVIIKGRDVELTKLERNDHRIPGWIVNAGFSTGDDGWKSNAEYREEMKDPDFYFFTTNGVDVIVSSYSHINVEGFHASHPWDYNPMPEQGRLYVINSQMTGSDIVINGKVRVVNCALNDMGACTLANSNLTGTNVFSPKSFDVLDSRLAGCSLSGKFISVKHVEGTKIRLSGAYRLTMENVKSWNDPFSISVINSNESRSVDINIHDTTLAAFSTCLFRLDKALTALNADSNNWTNPTIEICRRIDYGYFSALEQIPFVRVTNDAILVKDNLFRAEEYMRTSRPDTTSESNDYRPSYLIPPAPSFGAYSGNIYPGSEQFRRIEKLITGATSKQFTAVGKNGEALVNTLNDQIRSRLNLFVEAQLFD